MIFREIRRCKCSLLKDANKFWPAFSTIFFFWGQILNKIWCRICMPNFVCFSLAPWQLAQWKTSLTKGHKWIYIRVCTFIGRSWRESVDYAKCDFVELLFRHSWRWKVVAFAVCRNGITLVSLPCNCMACWNSSYSVHCRAKGWLFVVSFGLLQMTSPTCVRQAVRAQTIVIHGR